MHISKNKFFFLLINAFFDADSKSEIRIFRTALVFELYKEKEHTNRHNKTQVLKYFSMSTYEISILYRYYLYYFSQLNSYRKTVRFYVYYIFGWFTII